jgi:hypothetical protein
MTLPPAPNEPHTGLTEAGRRWLRVQAHVFPLLDAGRINLPDAAAMAGVSQVEMIHHHRVWVARQRRAG